MAYTRVNWQNSPSHATPLSAENLNVMDAGIASLDAAVGGHTTSIGTLANLTTTEKSTLVGAINEVNEDVSDVKEEFEQASTDITTLYDMGTLSSYNNDKVPYLFRPSGGGKYIGGIEKDTIVGGTVAWNQLVDGNSLPATDTVNGITFTNNGDGSIRVSGTATGTAGKDLKLINNVPVGHKALVISGASGGHWGTYVPIYDYNNSPVGENYSMESFVCFINNSTARLRTQVWSGQTVDFTITPQYIDLTQMFGSTIADYIYSLEQATAGSGVAKLKSWGFFTEDYYPYDSGSLKSVESLTSHDMVGFNQWDEEWELGTLDADGNPVASTVAIRFKNYMPVIEDATYFYHNGTNTDIKPWFYDSEKRFIKRYDSYISINRTFVVPNGCRYMRVAFPASYGTTYNHDICINLSSSRNGQYEPYIKHSYPLDDSLTLRGIPKLDSANQLYYDGDRYLPSGEVERRYGIVDLGTLNWTLNNHRMNTISALSDALSGNHSNCICSMYKSDVGATTRTVDMSICIANNGYIYIYDTSFDGDESAFKTAMDGVMLVYELATPTTETADPYQTPQLVDKNGTEEYVTTGIIPVGHDTDYYLDADSVLTPPSTAGTYSLKVTVASDGSKSYSWVSD